MIMLLTPATINETASYRINTQMFHPVRYKELGMQMMQLHYSANFFGQIWLDLSKIEAKFGKI